MDPLSFNTAALSHLSDSSMSLPQLISTSNTVKARLLHYFPPSPDTPVTQETDPVDNWCGWHKDHSLLTGLCSVNNPSESLFAL
jgi:hypothetical protein